MEWIGEYFIHRLIGEGGMGKVYEAEERLSKRRVALKVLRDDLARSEDGRRMFLREMTILSHLDHTNVVRCLACTEAGGHLVMVLEHLSGETLRDVLRQRGRLPGHRALEIASEVAAGLAAAHAQNPPIIHRDLKPENVMILADGHCKVMDFGIAKILDAGGSQTVFTVGTLQYMSPEQIEGFTVDARADLYCLGLLLYEMLAGHPPFASESPRELLNLHCTQAPPRFSAEITRELPPGLEELVFALLAKDRDHRPPNAEAVQKRIDQIRLGPAASNAPAPHAAAAAPARSTGTIMLIERAGAAQKRGHTLAIVLAIVGGVLLVGGGVSAFFFFSSREQPAAPTPAEPAAVPAKTEAKAAADPKRAPEPTKKEPTKEELDAKAEAIRQQALADRKAADAKVPPDPEPDQPDPNADPNANKGPGLTSSVLSSFGLGAESPPKPDERAAEIVPPADAQ